MLSMCKSLVKKFEELESFHHKTLHELADAAQIIKSYEYLEKQHQEELELLEKVLAQAEALCDSKDFETFRQNRVHLLRAIQKYRDFDVVSDPKTIPL